MPEKSMLPMLEDFPRWLSVTGIADNDERWKARWAGISALVPAWSREMTEALIRLALDSKRHLPAQNMVQQIRGAFHAADNTFEMVGNDKELRILAAATLAALMGQSGADACSTALAVSTSLIGGARKVDLPMDLGVLAEDAIVRLAEKNGEPPSLSSVLSTDNVELDFQEVETKAKENQIPVAFQKAAVSIEECLRSLLRLQQIALRDTERYMRVRDEELDMLWWLVGERSLDFDVPLEDVNGDAKPFVFAKELAALTHYAPGPRGIRSLLSRGGLKRKKIVITDAVNAAAPNWLRSFMPESDPSAVTLPVHFAAKRQLETGAGADWIAGWAASTEVPATTSLSALDLGVQIYRERLLISPAAK